MKGGVSTRNTSDLKITIIVVFLPWRGITRYYRCITWCNSLYSGWCNIYNLAIKIATVMVYSLHEFSIYIVTKKEIVLWNIIISLKEPNYHSLIKHLPKITSNTNSTLFLFLSSFISSNSHHRTHIAHRLTPVITRHHASAAHHVYSHTKNEQPPCSTHSYSPT